MQLSNQERSLLWQETHKIIDSVLDSGTTLPVFQPTDIAAWRRRMADWDFQHPGDLVSLLRVVSEGLNSQLNLSSPMYFGVFNPSPTAIGIAAEALVAAFNPQLASSASAPFSILVEEHLLRWFGEKFGYPADDASGTFTTGGSEANLTAMLLALNSCRPHWRREGVAAFGENLPRIYVSSETHHSFLRAALASGLGSRAIVTIPVSSNLQFDVSALTSQIQADRHRGFLPVMIVGTFGSTSAGVIDPLKQLALLANQEKLWFHLDAAWGGAAILLDEFKSYFLGSATADTITLDAHKWLNAPFGAGLLLTRHKHALESALSCEDIPYMPSEATSDQISQPYRKSLQWSRRFMGLKVFLSLALHGTTGYQEMFRRQILLANKLRCELSNHDWRVVNETPLPVVCFRCAHMDAQGIDPEAFKQCLAATGKTWITTTVLTNTNQKVFRMGINNFHTSETHIEYLIKLLGEVRLKMLGQSA